LSLLVSLKLLCCNGCAGNTPQVETLHLKHFLRKAIFIGGFKRPAANRKRNSDWVKLHLVRFTCLPADWVAPP